MGSNQQDQMSSEAPPPVVAIERENLKAVLQFLRKANLLESEGILRKEAAFFDEVEDKPSVSSGGNWGTYKSGSDPDVYVDTYNNLVNFIESALDMYKHELSLVLYPVLAHMYLELVYNGHGARASEFLNRFATVQELWYEEDVKRLKEVITQEHMQGSTFIHELRSTQFSIRMSRETYTHLRRWVEERKQGTLLSILQEHLLIEVYEGMPRTRQQIEATAGGMGGEAERSVNKCKVYYGLLKEPDIQIPWEEEEEQAEGEGDKPKKKKPKKDSILSKKMKNDPNAPPNTRLPLPELRDVDKMEKIRALRETTKRATLGSESMPSICFYTLLNSSHCVTCVDISEDSSLLSAGFSDSIIKVWSLLPQKLRGMKSAEELQDIDKEADDVLVRMLDDRTAESCKTLTGHGGPVYATSFSPDRALMLSCSEDATIRLWSLQMWVCVVVYKGHMYPVWSVKFSPHGQYFVSGGHDRTVRLWITDNHQAVRFYAGHFADVDVVQFHPNSNYIASGSSDRTVRLWDCVQGTCVRVMTGHKGAVQSLSFSVEGRFLASGGNDFKVLVWDLAHGHLLAELSHHTHTIYSLVFSRDGNILASGGADYQVCLWDFSKITEDVNIVEDMNMSHNPDVKTGPELLLNSYPTKHTPILALHFTRRNLLLGAGMFSG